MTGRTGIRTAIFLALLVGSFLPHTAAGQGVPDEIRRPGPSFPHEATHPAPGFAGHRGSPGSLPTGSVGMGPLSLHPGPAGAAPEDPEWPTWKLALASGLVPGAGQLVRGQQRGWAYLVAEALIWGGVVHERDRGWEARFAYRDLAWRVARGGSGSRDDGEFDYYERMSRWERSGAFDTEPGVPGVQPETDLATFNGDAWRLARAIHLGNGPDDPSNPGWDAALAYYRERAYGEDRRWDWSPAPDAFRTFGLLIDESDTRFARARLIAGGAILNRMVSALDVVLTRTTGRDTRLRVFQTPSSSTLTGPGTLRTGLFLQIRTP